MNPALAKTTQVFAAAVFAFILGGYSFLLSGACAEFTGGGAKWAWVAVIGCVVGLAVSLLTLMRDAWRSHAQKPPR
jgi:uncharacterized membrane protein